MNRRKIADLTSGVGALVLGVGLGALFADWIASAAWLIAASGLLMHAFGMWDKHRLESADHADARWIVAMYWLCWVLLAAVFVVLLFWTR